jgi:hypothetical protein
MNSLEDDQNKDAKAFAAAMKKGQTTLLEKVEANLKEIKTNDESLESLET